MTLSTTVYGDGPPLVLLPWFSLDGAVMATAFEPIFTAAESRRRIYIDLPGTGGSAAVAPSSDAVLDAVQATLADLLPGEPFDLLGCSYGGYLATGLARREPERVRRLALICSGVRIRQEHRNLDRVLTSDPEADWLAAIPEDVREHAEQAVGLQTRKVGDRIGAALRAGGARDDQYLEALHTIGYPLSDEASDVSFDGPVLMVAGRHDRVAGYLDQLDALSRYPHGNYVALAESGHYAPLEQPDELRAVLLCWLTSDRQPRG
jgi:pimeloyl-ACP methyl ester carboxylesterase